MYRCPLITGFTFTFNIINVEQRLHKVDKHIQHIIEVYTYFMQRVHIPRYTLYNSQCQHLVLIFSVTNF